MERNEPLERAAAALRIARRGIEQAIRATDNASRQTGRTTRALEAEMKHAHGMYFVHDARVADILRARYPEWANNIRTLPEDKRLHGCVYNINQFDHVLQDYYPERIPWGIIAPQRGEGNRDGEE